MMLFAVSEEYKVRAAEGACLKAVTKETWPYLVELASCSVKLDKSLAAAEEEEELAWEEKGVEGASDEPVRELK